MPPAPKTRVTVYLPAKLARQARQSAKQSGQSLSGWYALATVAMLANLAPRKSPTAYVDGTAAGASHERSCGCKGAAGDCTGRPNQRPTLPAAKALRG